MKYDTHEIMNNHKRRLPGTTNGKITKVSSSPLIINLLFTFFGGTILHGFAVWFHSQHWNMATSHYPSQCWPRSLSPYGVIRPEWVKISFLSFQGCFGFISPFQTRLCIVIQSGKQVFAIYRITLNVNSLLRPRDAYMHQQNQYSYLMGC